MRALLALAMLFSGAASAAEKITVLATFAPIYCFAKNVAGDSAHVEMLLPPHTGPHDFALAPSDLKKIAQAQVIVENGLGLESWLEKAIVNAARRDVLFIDSSKWLGKKFEQGARVNDEGFGKNPHVWLDPLLACEQVRTIADLMGTGDPAHAAVYQRNGAAYIERLKKLDADIRSVTDRLARKRLLTFHDSFARFAARYGFEIVGVVEPFPGREPTPKELKRLRDVIRAKNVSVLFCEPQFSPKLLQSLAEDLKLPVVAIDPMETGEASADFYETVMRRNLSVLKKALK